MKYLYTTKPDEHCHEVEPGIYGRPAQTSEQSKLRKLGWVYHISDLKGDAHVREEKEGRKEEVEVRKVEADKLAKAGEEFYESGEDKPDSAMVAENDLELARLAYEKEFGRKPHHKAKLETIIAKLKEADGDD